MAMRALLRRMASKVSGSMSNPNWVANRTARIMRSGSSEKVMSGIARRADGAILQVVHAVEGIDQLAEGVAVDRPGHGVDRGRGGAGRPPAFRPRPPVCASRGCRGFAPGPRTPPPCPRVRTMAVPKVLNTDTFGAEPAPSARRFYAAAHDHHVHVGGRTPQVVVAHVPPRRKIRTPRASTMCARLPELGIGERPAARLSRRLPCVTSHYKAIPYFRVRSSRASLMSAWPIDTSSSHGMRSAK